MRTKARLIFRTAILFFIFHLSFFILTGCSHFRPGRKVGDPQQTWKKVIDNYRLSRPPYRAEGQLSIRNGEHDQTISFTLRWQRPGLFRVDVSGFLGFTLASAAINDTSAWLSVPIRNIYLSSSIAQVDSLSTQTLGVALEPLLKILEGCPPLPAGELPFVSDTTGTLFSFSDSLASRVYRIDPRNMMIERYRFAGPDSVWQQISYGNWHGFSNTYRPGQIELSKPSQDIRLNVIYDKIAQVDSFDPGIWRQNPPQDKKPVGF